MEWLSNLFDLAQDRLFEGIVQPALFSLGLMDYADMAFDGVEFFLIGCCEVVALAIILLPLEALWPAERWSARREANVDLIYTLLHRLGVLPLLLFALIAPLQAHFDEWLLGQGVMVPTLDQWLPALAGLPFVTFLLYVVILDFTEYWFHRAQHRFGWWWALHSLHHSQRQMSLWTEDRNHLLDDLLSSLRLALVGSLIGVPPEQFVLAVVLIRALQNLAHANLRISFGRLGQRLLVGPRYHRVHHAIGIGHEGPARGCNFANLLPVWDILFGTANFAPVYPATGVRDQLEGVEYGRGFLIQQWLGLKRLARHVAGRPAAVPGAG